MAGFPPVISSSSKLPYTNAPVRREVNVSKHGNESVSITVSQIYFTKMFSSS